MGEETLLLYIGLRTGIFIFITIIIPLSTFPEKFLRGMRLSCPHRPVLKVVSHRHHLLPVEWMLVILPVITRAIQHVILPATLPAIRRAILPATLRVFPGERIEKN